MLASRDHILSAQDLPSRDIEIPEWNCTVRVRALTASQRDLYERGIASGDGKIDTRMMKARLLVLACIGEDGSPLFTEADIPALQEKSAAAIERLFAAAGQLSAMFPKQVDELGKN